MSEESRRLRLGFVRGDESQAVSIADERQGWERAVEDGNRQLDVAVRADNLGGVAGEWVGDPSGPHGRVVLYCHGGGYSSGSPRTHRKLAAHLARIISGQIFLVEYRLAPEHPCPAAVNDVATVYGALLERGFAPKQLVLGGDSSGGGLALATLAALKDVGVASPAAAFAISPMTDLTLTGPTISTHASRDPLTTIEGLSRAARWYLGGRDARDPLASPLYANLAGLPPLLIQAGTEELLLSDATRLAERVRAAGGQVELEIWEDMWHVWHAWAGEMPEANEAIEQIGSFIDRHLPPCE